MLRKQADLLRSAVVPGNHRSQPSLGHSASTLGGTSAASHMLLQHLHVRRWKPLTFSACPCSAIRAPARARDLGLAR